MKTKSLSRAALNLLRRAVTRPIPYSTAYPLRLTEDALLAAGVLRSRKVGKALYLFPTDLGQQLYDEYGCPRR